jgi:methylenetetrahydrofolate reductase (NADPH)
MNFKELLGSEQFLTIAALEPPKGADFSGFLKNADRLKGRVQAVMVPEMSGAIMRMGSMGASCLLKGKGIETILSMNCRDRNRLALQADMLSAAAFGLKNLFVSEGDEIKSGDHIEAKAVHDLEVTDLLEAAKKLQKGIDLSGNDLSGCPQFCIGSEINAGLKEGALEVEIKSMEKKITAGAQFFFTPAMYDLKTLTSFMDRVAPFKIPIFPQVTILKSVGMARFMCRHMDGVMIPDEVLDRLGKAPDKIKEGILIAADMIKALKGVCRGVLLVAVGGEERLPEVLEQVEV